MEKFLFIVREDLNILKTFTDAQRQQGMQEMIGWIESLAESWNYIGGEPLEASGKYVTKDEIVSDGPFIEAKEGVSGYLLVGAENIEQAASFAQTCPLVLDGRLAIEVRPIVPINHH